MNRSSRRLLLAIALAVPTVVGATALAPSQPLQAVDAGSVTEVVVAGVNGVAPNASAVVLNVTAADAPGAGYVTAWPCGEARPNASNLNYRPGGAVANSAIVKVGAGGKVCLFAETATQLIVDVNGWFPAGADYSSGSPARLLDTRSGGSTVDGVDAGTGLRGAGSTTELVVAGRGGVAPNASAVVLNVTAADAPGAGYVTAWPCGEARPNASNLNYRPGGAVANSAIVKVGGGGKVCLFAETATQLIVDVNGWFPTGADYSSGSPARLLDTRSGGSTVDGVDAGTGLRGAGSTTELVVAGRGGVAPNASAVVLNVTAADAPGAGYVTAWPCGEGRPNASNLNYRPGGAVANSAIVKVGGGGKVCLFAETATQLIVDVNGWFPAGADYQAMTPVRLLDSRPTSNVVTPPAPPTGQFVETFTGGAGLDRFDSGVYHRDPFLIDETQWQADHDMACGDPTTSSRTVHRDTNEWLFACRDHVMTSIGDTSGYSTAWFSPKQSFTGVRSVSWDVNVTDLKDRKWWEVAVVSASFNTGVASCPQCSVSSWLSGTAGIPAYPSNAVVVGNGPLGGDLHVFSNNTDYVNAINNNPICGSNGMDKEGCGSKALRRTFKMTDNGNGTITLNAFGYTKTFPGRFPAGAVSVVFKDHNYTPNKDGVPVGSTWHWDNVIIQ